jgi:outer membrane protein insertion porin family
MVRSMQGYCVERRFPLAEITASTEPVPGRPGHVFAVFTVDEEAPVFIGEVIFRGRSALPAKKLLRAIKSKPGGFLRPSGKYEEDLLVLDAARLQSIYRDSGYSDARVTALPAEIGPPVGRRNRRLAKVIFDISEGRLYTLGPVTFKGLESVTDEEAAKRSKLVPGEPYSDEAMMAAARRVRALLGETGRPFCGVLPRRVRTAEEGVVGVEFTVNEGAQATVGEIRIRGNSRTRDRVIRREMELLPGEIFDSRRLSESRNNIRARQIFEKVLVTPVPGEEPDTVDIEVEVEETRTGALNIGGSVAPENGSVGLMMGITENNFDWRRLPGGGLDSGGAFRGGAQRMSFNFNLTETITSLSLNYTNPWIWDTPEHYSFGTSLFHTDKEFDEYDDERTGARVRLGRILFLPRVRASLSAGVQRVHMEGLDEDLAPDILEEDEGTTLLSSVALGFRIDLRDSRLMPSRGLLFGASEEIFGGFMGGDANFRQTSVDGHFYLPLFKTWGYQHLIHVYARADWANPFNRDDRIPIFERFFAGGVSTVRGYDYRTLSPRYGDEPVGGGFRTVQNFEYIFPIFQNTLRGVIYFDAGNVWAEEGDFEWHDQARSVGVGLHIHTPPAMGQMPIKLYFSRAINPRDEYDTETFQMTFSFLF